ncbi:sigma-70 family RNA polymerase sigma factor [Nocardioides jishulii]|uniref:Sigma-70 family RNA polymerase sigma factor n=1 Tax=Nocardioides jishulii TaxID=2575440 RepID=A0A4U2YN05_9ACTN|nr:sigma-70 family RNA polymerase sigma factor [Nocardioides jishulii]QCX27840.1 sigma-70 family RNA polymerase sigma factor [Nocardioides jishulii]TKI62647.1 sigma-70 family RNA polymerase sigma factor [Nocardioides jishulii]
MEQDQERARPSAGPEGPAIVPAPREPAHESMPREARMSLVAELFARSRTAQGEEREAFLREIVLLNQCVAESIAMRYVGRGIAPDDLRQVACEALVKAVHRFDPTRDRDLLSYAVPTIRGEIRRHFRDHGWSVRPPRRIQEVQAQVTRATDELAKKHGRDPEVAEVLDEVGISRHEYDQAVQAYGSFRAASLDQPRGADGSAAWSELMADDPRTEEVEARLTLAPVVRQLPARDRRILYLRFYEDMTQSEIGQELGVTQTQVSRLLTGIYDKVRAEVGDIA